MSDLHEIQLELTGHFTARHVLVKPENPRELWILLHGFSQSGDFFFHKLKSILPADVAVLAPHGPFPNVEGKPPYKVGYAWYFYEMKRDEYYIDMKVAVDYIAALVEKLDLGHLPKRVIGYSQGGYFAPFAALELSNVLQVVGVSCQFLEPELPSAMPFRMDEIHGSQDDIVDGAMAQVLHKRLVDKGNRGEFKMIEGGTHRLDAAITEEIKTTLIKI